MRSLRWVILIAAVAAGVGVVALVQRELDSARRDAANVAPAAAPAQIETVDVLVAGRSLDRGASIGQGDLVWRPWPAEVVVGAYVTRDSDPEAVSRLGGALVRSDIIENEPVLPGKVIERDAEGVMSILLRDGMRALAIAVAPETGAGGFILPGDFVDVILTREADVEVRKASGEIEEESFLFTDTLITNVRTLAIDTAIKDEGDPAIEPRRTATLEVTPDMAELLSLAERAGRITLSLRAFADSRSVEGELPSPAIEVDLDRIGSLQIGRMSAGNSYEFDGDESGAASAGASGQPRTVTVIRGSARTDTAVAE